MRAAKAMEDRGRSQEKAFSGISYPPTYPMTNGKLSGQANKSSHHPHHVWDRSEYGVDDYHDFFDKHVVARSTTPATTAAMSRCGSPYSRALTPWSRLQTPRGSPEPRKPAGRITPRRPPEPTRAVEPDPPVASARRAEIMFGWSPEAMGRSAVPKETLPALSSEGRGKYGDDLHWHWTGHSMGDAGAVRVADALLRSTKPVAAIFCSSNRIGDKGAAAFGAALRSNATLTHLDLSRNNIGDAGMVELAQGLTLNQTLRILDLQQNKIGNQGAKALYDLLCMNHTIDRVHLHNNKEMGPKWIRSLREFGGRIFW